MHKKQNKWEKYIGTNRMREYAKLTFLRFVLIDLLVMFPTHSARVHSVVLDAKLSSETGLVI